jgi:hypothetical protein
VKKGVTLAVEAPKRREFRKCVDVAEFDDEAVEDCDEEFLGRGG